MIRELGESLGNTVVETVGRAVSRAQENRALPVDLLESDDAYLAVFDAPGATASDVQVRFQNGTVLVKLDRFREFHQGFEMRFPGRGLALDGRVDLPEGAGADPGGATATLMDNGTLQVRIPKRETDVHGDEDSDSEVTVAEEGKPAHDADTDDPDPTTADGDENA